MTKRSTHWHSELRKKVLENSDMRAEYEAYQLSLELADQLKQARKHAHLTQENVADLMGTQKPMVARIEAGGGKHKHSPTLLTIVKFALAIGCKVEIQLTPKLKANRD